LIIFIVDELILIGTQKISVLNTT